MVEKKLNHILMQIVPNKFIIIMVAKGKHCKVAKLRARDREPALLKFRGRKGG